MIEIQALSEIDIYTHLQYCRYEDSIGIGQTQKGRLPSRF